MKEIPLTQGKVALVDDEDYERVARYKWCAVIRRNGSYYAFANGGRLLMHRFILGVTGGSKVDHYNQNTLDNTRANLRLATTAQNGHNMRKHRDNESGYKGVSLVRATNKYQVQLQVNGKRVWVGGFTDPKQAALEYDRLARLHFGEFARTNF